jgi:glycosyltransferase involved in cell wall biosynthesis
MDESVAVVIPCYKQAHWLADAIESALAQTYPVRVIVVNDGSPDDTSEVARRYPVTLIEQENKGLSAARNAGIREAGEGFILPLDSDDMIAPTYVEKALPLFTEGVKAVNCWQHEFGDHQRVTRLGVVNSVEDIIHGNRLVCCSMFRYSDWKRVGGYDENMRLGYEDWEFWIRLLKWGGRVETIPEPLFHYRKHGHSMVSETNARFTEVTNYIMAKHIGLYGR